MTNGDGCKHLELYYSTKHGQVVDWLCPACRDVVCLGPPQCAHLGLTLGPAKGSEAASYHCNVSGCPSSYALPDAFA